MNPQERLNALIEFHNSNPTIMVGEPLNPSAQALMETLGVTVEVVPGAPTKPPEGLFYDPWDKRYRHKRTGS